MKSFLFETVTQLIIIAAIWVIVARDAGKLRDKHGSTPLKISPFAWGALSGISYVAIIPYLILRNNASRIKSNSQERNLLTLWIVLSISTAIWATNQASHQDFNNAAQHFLLTAIFVSCAVLAFYRDHRSPLHSDSQ